MQTTLLGLAIAFILALVAALVGPYFIDWNQFRPQFEAEATRVVGMPVRVRGALDARLLPAPALRLRSVTVGSTNDLGRIRADRLDVEFSLSSLMRGEWRATELTVGDAAVDLGLDAHGRIDLPAATGVFSLGGLAIDRLHVTGRVALHDAASRTTLELSDITFRGDVRSLAAGAMRGDGNFMLSGVRYPFRISSGPTSDGNGNRIRLTVDPGEKPLSVDIDGILNFDNRRPRFDGQMNLARPQAKPQGPGEKAASHQAAAPWRISARVKADAASARFDAVEASYGAEDNALKMTGTADFRLGDSPLLRAVLAAKNLDIDRQLAAEGGASDQVRPWPVLRRLMTVVPRPAFATQLELGAEQIMLGGRPVQNVSADLRGDAAAWTVERLEFHAPGATRVSLSGGALVSGAAHGFKGAVNIDSTDPDALAGWINGRSDIAPRNQKPLRLRGNFASAADRLSIEALKAEIDGSTVEGRIAYSYSSAAGGSRIDADLKADRLDVDAATALIRSLGGTQTEWPDAAQISLDIACAISAGQELRPLLAQFAYSPASISLDRLKVGEASGLMLEGNGAFDRVNATGKLALNATAASLSEISGIVAPLAPAVAARLNAMTAMPGATRVKLALEATSEQPHTDRSQLRAVLDIDAPQVKGTMTIGAAPKMAAIRGIDLDALSQSELSIESLLTGQGKQLVALLGLGDMLDTGNALLSFEGSATGAWRSPLRLKARLSGADVDAEVQGVAEPWAATPEASVMLALRRANLAPLLDLKPADDVARNISLSSRVTLNGDRLVFEDIDSTLAGSRLHGRVALTLGSDRFVDGQIGVDRLEFGQAFALAIGTRGRDVSDPLGHGLLQGWRGQVAWQALSGKLPGGTEVGPVSGIVRSDGQSLSIDAIKGQVGGGEITADIDLKPALVGYALGARVQLSGADGAALRYRSLALPAGKTSLRMTLGSQGRSASALEGALSGNGLLTMESARIGGLDPRAFDVAMRASDSGQATDDAKLRRIVEPVLSGGALSVAAAQVPFALKDGRLRVGATTLDAEGARAILSGGYDIVADQADIRASLTATAEGASSVRPEIQVFAAGSPDKLDVKVDVASLSSWLAVRAIDRETRRLDSLERGALPPAAVPIAIPPSGAASTPFDVPGPRQASSKAATPRPAASPPIVSQQIAPLPAPIEIRPVPGAKRTPKPRPAAPFVVTPPANSARPTF